METTTKPICSHRSSEQENNIMAKTKQFAASDTALSNKLIKCETVNLNATKYSVRSMAILRLFNVIWDKFSGIITRHKSCYYAYILLKSLMAISIALVEWIQFYYFAPYLFNLIIVSILTIHVITYFVLKALSATKQSLAWVSQNLIITVHSNLVMFILFTVNLFDCTRSLDFDDNFATELQCALGYAFELPEMAFGIIEIVIICSFLVIYTFEVVAMLLLCKIRLHNKLFRSVQIHLYLYEESIHESVCIICQTPFDKCDYISKLSCTCIAFYHKHCIVEWYLRHEECPLCKHKVAIS